MSSRHLSADLKNISGIGPRPLVHLDHLQARHRNQQRLLSEQSSANYISPEAQAIDKWFEDLSYYEKTLQEMSITTLDDTFKDELSTIENWFRVLSDPERTACLYSLLKGTTPLQIKFFITVLTQMAAKDASLDPLNVIRSPSGVRPSSIVSNQTEDISRLFGRPNSQRLSSHGEYSNSRRLSTENRPTAVVNSSSQDDFSDGTISPVAHQRMPIYRDDVLGSGVTDWVAVARSPLSPPKEYLDLPKIISKPGSSLGGALPPRSPFDKSSPSSPIGSPTYSHIPARSSRNTAPVATAAEVPSISPRQKSRAIPNPRQTEEECSNSREKLSNETIDLNEIQDIPTWFRSLRLHKYTTIFENDDWRAIIKLTEDDLISRGVAALGARRKMLKVFESVRNELEAKKIPF